VADPRSGMNLPAPRALQSLASIKNAALDAGSAVGGVLQKVNTTESRAVAVYQGGEGVSSNQVAPSPRFTPPSTSIVPTGRGGGGGGGGGGPRTPIPPFGDEPSDNQLFQQPQSFTRNLTNYVKQNPAAAMLYAGAVGSGALSSTEEITQAEL